jgi:5-formyltetrahydrofolate cyclo-ligase
MDKQSIRQDVWDELEESGVARFPFPPHGRIPNFEGADAAAGRLTESAAWRDAERIKSNPDAPQRPVRRRALAAGKTVFMAVPRLADERCFLRLDPTEIDDIDHATTLSGSEEVGTQIGPGDIDSVDLIVSGSVAVDRSGSRIGKGEGYSDLEYAILRELGLVDDGTPVATTVHERQVRESELPTGGLDVPLNIICTPERSLQVDPREKPSGISWDELSAERRSEIPILDHLYRQR